ncbi:MAG: MoxR family ATPase [Acidobacteriota bacterium]
MNASATVPSAAPIDAAAHDPQRAIHALETTIGRIVQGKDDVIRLAIVALLADGHILIEDVPGVGKTTLAQAVARAMGHSFQRIQFTSDLMPSDIIGVSVYRQRDQQFEFVQGPLFAHVVLADEINRATPKTQSALLEAMSERTVTVERTRHALPRPFLVLATQNPLEHFGTFPLPESQLDRFLMTLQMGYPAPSVEKALLRAAGDIRQLLEDTVPAVDTGALQALQQRARAVHVAEPLLDYLLALAHATRDDPDFALPVSTRGAQGLYRATQALALCEGRDHALPEDVKRLAVPVLAHRVTLKRGSGDLDDKRAAIERLIATTPVPV